MPLYMDVHTIEGGLAATDVEQAHGPVADALVDMQEGA